MRNATDVISVNYAIVKSTAVELTQVMRHIILTLVVAFTCTNSAIHASLTSNTYFYSFKVAEVTDAETAKPFIPHMSPIFDVRPTYNVELNTYEVTTELWIIESDVRKRLAKYGLTLTEFSVKQINQPINDTENR